MTLLLAGVLALACGSEDVRIRATESTATPERTTAGPPATSTPATSKPGATPEATLPRAITVAAVGDLMLARDVAI